MTQYLIGVDIGTSSTKSILFNSTGAAIHKCSARYPLYTPTPNAAEQEPTEIFMAVLQTVRQVITDSQIQPKQILGLSFSAAMHSLITVGANGKLLTRCYTWADNRSAVWAEQLRRSPISHALYQRTGTPIHAMSPLVKLIWLRHTQPAMFAQATKFIGIKEYVLHRLCQQFVVDHSIASATGLLNLTTLDWDTEALALAGITAEHLPQLVPTTQVLPLGNCEIANGMGVLPTTPVVVGANDGVLSNLGLGAIAPGMFAITIGTSGAIRTVVHQPTTDPQQRTFCYVLNQKHWVIGGAVNNGGIILQWLRDQLALAPTYDALMALADTVPPGAEGLIFHPYLLGERSPLWNADARGSFWGLTIQHNHAHLVRAVLEGIVFNLFQVFQILQSLAGHVQSIQIAGGFTASQLVRQIIADVFNCKILVPEQLESSSLGAAILGFHALGGLDLATPLSRTTITQSYEPIPKNVAVYQHLLPLYERLVNLYQNCYSEISQLQQQLGDHTLPD